MLKPMEMPEIVTVLNRERHGGWDDWRAVSDTCLMASQSCCGLSGFEGWAIANAYAFLRSATPRISVDDADEEQVWEL